jgi:hypothetical protein
MSTLKWVEEVVGGVESWPTCMILNMFVVQPNEHAMKKVAAFLYGNGVPVEMAVECYVACRGREHIQAINQAILSWYYTWNRETHKRHMSEYYNIRYKTQFLLNGKSLNQEEVWMPEVTVMEMGVKGKIDLLFPGWEWVLLNVIEYVRGTVGHDSFQDGKVS